MDKLKVIAHLRALGNKEIEPRFKGVGICSELHDLFATKKSSGYELVETYSKLWEEFSGNNEYPVPCTNKEPNAAFTIVWDLWDNTPYGDSRRRLCSFLADCLEKEIRELAKELEKELPLDKIQLEGKTGENNNEPK